MLLVRGQKVKLVDLSSEITNQLRVNISVDMPVGMVLCIACLGIDAKNTLIDKKYFIYRNQKSSPCGSLISLGSKSGDMEQFQIDFSIMPSTINKVAFIISIDGNGLISEIKEGTIRLLSRSSELAQFTFTNSEFTNEKAIIVGELYFKELWRFASIGQGFNGGLITLLKHFGTEDINELFLRKTKSVSIGKVIDILTKLADSYIGRKDLSAEELSLWNEAIELIYFYEEYKNRKKTNREQPPS